MGEIETAIEAITGRPVVFETDEVARAGAFVSIAPDGSVRIERGFVRPEDELRVDRPRRDTGADRLGLQRRQAHGEESHR